MDTVAVVLAEPGENGASLGADRDGRIAGPVDPERDPWRAADQFAAVKDAAQAARADAFREAIAIANAAVLEFGPLTGTGALVVANRLRGLCAS
jgi:hypothetical protein